MEKSLVKIDRLLYTYCCNRYKNRKKKPEIIEEKGLDELITKTKKKLKKRKNPSIIVIQ